MLSYSTSSAWAVSSGDRALPLKNENSNQARSAGPPDAMFLNHNRTRLGKAERVYAFLPQSHRASVYHDPT